MAYEDSNPTYAAATGQKDRKPQPLRGVLHRFPRAILAIAECTRVGTEKRGIPLEDMSFADDPQSRVRYGEALVRHLLAEAIEGPVNTDPADQCLWHDVQEAWDALARLECRLKQDEQWAEEMANRWEMEGCTWYEEYRR